MQLRLNFTLPELQNQLDSLAEGALFPISAQDYQRLFGTNDAAAARLRAFARGHACIANHSNGPILFRKNLVPPDDNFQLGQAQND
jgi:hypothetical protein